MDAGAYLKRQGWRGAGHSLDHQDRGIKKPLLIAHKQDQLGLGKKKAAHTVDDQWWMRAFDESLQNIGTGQESTLSQVRKQGINRGGLYGFFVRGEGLEGTITDSSSPNTTADTTRDTTPDPTMSSGAQPTKKRKRDDLSRGAIRKRRKEEAAQTIRTTTTLDADRRREKAVANGTHDEAVEEEAVIMKRIDRKAKRKAEEDVESGQLDLDKSLAGKKDKQRREKALRAATKVLKKIMFVDAMMKGELPNTKGYTRDEALANYERDMEEKTRARKAQRSKAKEEKGTAQASERTEKAAAKTQRRKQKKQETQSSSESTSAIMDPNLDIAKHQKTISAQISSLTDTERAQYESRAATKSLSLEQYILLRMQKKEKKSQPVEAPLPFFTDLSGDKTLLKKARSEHSNPYKLNPDGSIPLDPVVWDGRPVKALSKEEREARRQYLAQRRERRKARQAPRKAIPLPEGKAKETKTKHQKKLAMLQGLTGKLLHERGIEKGATEKQMKEARRDAKAILKEEKKESKETSRRGKLDTKKKQNVGKGAKVRHAKRSAAVPAVVEVSA
ncbi:hypothetical protein K491DRAFT_686969 [Lophiostoma macrostomum CBS 122681]|uniref:G-patch domain-containing protein n=1 Tax=Lophiostoma macrostomum CBS 122681 TaxID=1314788 RepID=A0A6A6TPI6_9PLEO|nr:hypothetical protein K491DRAFT_686969 [Lophiostoma macrostomum CBS 122681]